MREILFRGKRIDNGEWVEGGIVQGMTLHVYIVAFSGDQPSPRLYEVDPATVGQYTGLTDKNGVKVFEGDIVLTEPDEHNNGRRYVNIITADELGFMFKESGCDDELTLTDFFDPAAVVGAWTVVGDVYGDE